MGAAHGRVSGIDLAGSFTGDVAQEGRQVLQRWVGRCWPVGGQVLDRWVVSCWASRCDR